MPEKDKVLDDTTKYPIFSGYQIVGYYDEYNIDKNELIVIARGVGGTGDVKLTPARCYLTNLSIGFSIDQNYALTKFLYYYFQINHLGYLNSGSAQPQITINDLKHVEVPLPPLNIQSKIIDIIDTIDEKIKINKEINKNLSKVSNAIHFDFIKTISNNKECSFIELKELGEIVMGQSPKGTSYNYDNVGLPLINGAADYENGFLKAQKYTSEPKKTCNKNDLIFCIRATIGLLVICDKEYCLGRGVAAITNINPQYKEYAFHLINSSIENFKRAATGSVISGISRKDIENIIIKIPSDDEIKRYHNIQKPIFEKLENNRIEIEKLTKLRDTLLPKLMSGEIDVSKINCDLE